jgi:protein-S-isoprenylcysteine O-methyltransferase Ste14
MTPTVVAVGGVTGGWVIFAMTLVPILRRGRGRSTRRDGLSLAAMLLQGVGFAFAWSGVGRMTAGVPLHENAGVWTWAVIACVLAVASGTFGVAAVHRLGRQWSFVARVSEGHELITSGPYAVVRHPIYTAMLGLLVATGMTFSSVPATLAGAGLYVIGTLLRTRIEERLLVDAFGERYLAYRRHVPALIPFAAVASSNSES